MSTFNPSRYRYIDWIAGRILEAAELNKLQQVSRGVAADGITPWAWDLGAVYQEGATFNVTPVISGSTVTLTATVGGQPMLVFVRGRWEILQTGEAPAVTLISGQTQLYLNWWLTIRDSTADPSLVDSTTGAPTAKMGELVLQVSATDNSVTGLDTGLYFQKNPLPVVLFTFAVAAGTGILTVSSSSGVQANALASSTKAGLVSLTTSTSSGLALASDDPSTSNTRNPNPLSVTDAAVRAPVLTSGGNTQPLGTGPGQDPGGISTAKLVHVPTSQTASAVIEATRTQAAATQAALASHAGSPLAGSSAVAGALPHPLPLPSDIGAAPVSHVGRVLDPAFTVGGSSRAHPAQVNVDTGGFAVVHDTNGPAVVHVPSTTPDPGFGVFDLSRVLQSGVLNNGDVYSLLAQNKPVAAPLQEAGDPTLTSGPLGLASVVAAVLGEHVNKTSHKNPHGLAASDLPITPLVTAYPAGSDGDGPIATAPLNLMSVVASVLAAHVNKTSHKNPHGLGAGDFGFTWASNSNGWTITIPASPTPILLQLGQIASMGGGDQNQFGVTFPTRFPNACFGAFAVTRGAFSPFYDRITFVKDGATTASGCTVCNNGSGAGATWFAIGN